VKLHCYPETDSLYIELQPAPSFAARKVVDGLNIDFGLDGSVVGIDIDGASCKLDLSVLETVSRPVRGQKAA
jgi:uncharacterized protein YuzE